MVRATDFQCRGRISPEFNHPPTQYNQRGGDEALLNKVHTLKNLAQKCQICFQLTPCPDPLLPRPRCSGSEWLSVGGRKSAFFIQLIVYYSLGYFGSVKSY